jgi:hypothetical protein
MSSHGLQVFSICVLEILRSRSSDDVPIMPTWMHPLPQLNDTNA